MNDGVVRFRPGWRQLPWACLLVPLAVIAPGIRDRGVSALLVAAVLLTPLFVLGFHRGTGVDLHRDVVVVRRIDQQAFPWHDVTGVDTRSLLGTKSVRVWVRGYPIRLWAPTHTPFLAPDPEFDAKVRLVEEYWRAATSAGSAP